MDVDFRIENCAAKLSSWADVTFGAIKKKISSTEKRLKAAQRCQPDARMLATCKSIAEELNSLHKLEESYWHLRLRANEIRDGDKNSQYFHHKASSRQWRNTIKGLTDPCDGGWKTSKADIERLITAYYQNLFQTSSPSGFEEDVAGLGEIVTTEMNEILEVDPTYDEVRRALFQMHPTKAPGTDGFHALFFQKFLILWVMIFFVWSRDGGMGLWI